jgi:DNA-binding PadR family transcriptional regulator
MTMRLVILGLLMEEDRHPYDIRQTMKERAMHHYIKLQDGSLYYAMDQLRKEGSVEAVEVIKDTSRPDKTIYRITDRGRERFHELLIRQFEEPDLVYHPLYAALSFAKYGDPEQITEILRIKIEEQMQYSAHMKAVYEEHSLTVPRAVLHMMMGKYEHSQTELAWLKRLLKDAEAGRLKERGTPLEQN